MKKLVFISMLLLMGCNNQNMKVDSINKSNEICNSLKKEIEENFKLKDYSRTIEMFIAFESCYADEALFLHKLGLLYKVNEQEELANKTFNLSVQKLIESKKLSKNEIAILKAGTYMIMGNYSKTKEEIKKIDKSKLTESQKEEIEYLEFFTNQGEFVSAKHNVDFELFDN